MNEHFFLILQILYFIYKVYFSYSRNVNHNETMYRAQGWPTSHQDRYIVILYLFQNFWQLCIFKPIEENKSLLQKYDYYCESARFSMKITLTHLKSLSKFIYCKGILQNMNLLICFFPYICILLPFISQNLLHYNAEHGFLECINTVKKKY
jgi:hypothetical protein